MKTKWTARWIILTLLLGVLEAIPQCIVAYCVLKATGNGYLAFAALLVTGMLDRPAKQ